MTDMTIFQKTVMEKLPNVELRFDEPMSRHTSFRIGGPVAVMAFPKRAEELSQILKVSALLDINPAILGAGTNVLAPDDGIDGLVVCLKDCMGGMEQLDDTTIRVAAGVTMTRAAMFAANLGLAGMEFAHGIPGTVGGGVYMNAGAYGGEIKDICVAVDVMDMEGNITRRSGADMKFAYRHSILEDEGGIVLSAEFKLRPASTEEVKATMRELQNKRSASQPLDLPSAGSAFKRPVGGFAAALIDQAGLKGYTVGGATAADVRNLLSQVSDIVFEKSGIRLEPEVRIW